MLRLTRAIVTHGAKVYHPRNVIIVPQKFCVHAGPPNPKDNPSWKEMKEMVKERTDKVKEKVKIDPASLPRLASEDSDRVSLKQQEIRRNIFFRFLKYLTNYELLLEKVLPKKAFEMSKLFVNGSKLIIKDMKDYAYIYSILSETSDWKKGWQSLPDSSNVMLTFLSFQLVELSRENNSTCIDCFPMNSLRSLRP